MKLFTVHAVPPQPPGPEGWPEPKARPPALLPEGFCVAAGVLGFLWFAWHRLWWEAAAMFLLPLLAALVLPEPLLSTTIVVLHLVAGFEARDRQRLRLERQGMALAGVIVAQDEDLAWFRLGQQRPDLVRQLP